MPPVPPDAHDHGHDHGHVSPAAPAAPTPPAAPAAAPAAAHDHGHDHAHVAPHAAHPAPNNRGCAVGGCGLLIAATAAAALSCAGISIIHGDQKMHAPQNYPIRPITGTNATNPSAPAQFSPTTPQQGTLSKAHCFGQRIVVDPTVRADMKGRAGLLDSPIQEVTAAYPANSDVTAWTRGDGTFNYTNAFFKDGSRAGDCHRASDILTLEACVASVGGARCTDKHGTMVIGDHDKLPSALQTVWNDGYAACMNLR